MSQDALTSLVVGSDGFIGHALTCKLCHIGIRVIETTRRQDTIGDDRVFLDLAQDIDDWQPPKVAMAYLLAAETSLSACQQFPEITSRINVENTTLIARKICANGGRVIFMSTNRVFDGKIPFRKPSEPVCPVVEYGRQKARAEANILAIDPNNSILRITKILPPTLLLIQNWIKRLQDGLPIQAFRDMKMAPVTLDLITSVLTRLAYEPVAGILHISGPEDISYYEAACHLAERMSASQSLIEGNLSTDTSIGKLIPPMEHTTLSISEQIFEWGFKTMPSMQVLDSVYQLDTYL